MHHVAKIVHIGKEKLFLIVRFVVKNLPYTKHGLGKIKHIFAVRNVFLDGKKKILSKERTALSGIA
jgi:hypothetical protein